MHKAHFTPGTNSLTDIIHGKSDTQYIKEQECTIHRKDVEFDAPHFQ